MNKIQRIVIIDIGIIMRDTAIDTKSDCVLKKFINTNDTKSESPDIIGNIIIVFIIFILSNLLINYLWEFYSVSQHFRKAYISPQRHSTLSI